MKQILVAVALVLVGLAPGVSQATTIFFDDFNNEALTLNHVFADKWTVVPGSGTVDLIGAPGFFDLIPGNGRYVDLDGTAKDPGIMASTPFTLFAGQTYDFSFDYAGSQRGDTHSLFVGFDFNNDGLIDFNSGGPILNVLSGTGLTSVLSSFLQGSDTTARIIFTQDPSNSDAGISNNIGLLVDNVKLSAVPEPASLMLLGAGLAAIGIWRRKATKV